MNLSDNHVYFESNFVKQKCFLSYTGRNGRAASTKRGNGWTNEGIEAFNGHLMNVFNDRENYKEDFDLFFLEHCKKIEQAKLHNSAFAAVSRLKRRRHFDLRDTSNAKQQRTQGLKMIDLMNDDNDSSDDSFNGIFRQTNNDNDDEDNII